MGTTDMATIIPPKTTDDADTAAFKAVFEDVVELVINDLSSLYNLNDENRDHIRKSLVYNVPHGKLNRGLAVFQCYKAFRAGSENPVITPKQQYEANLLGWCVELLQAFFLVADDIMDDSVTRRGQPCFFRLPEIGLKAINDSIILEAMIFRILRLHFKKSDCYVNLVELFMDITYTTEIGQMLDLTSQDDQKPVQLDRFTDDMLMRIYRYKTSHYTFYLPVALGMCLAGVNDEDQYDTAKHICLEMGHYFQAQDDYLDAFGDPEITGKVGTDIEENTCTWLVVEALKKCTEEDKELIQQNYGKKNKENSDKVKDLYRRLKIPEAFVEFEQSSYVKMRGMIDEVSNMPTGAFEFLLQKIYKRKK